ncbi:MAG: hypothetical protein K2Q97_05350, partial [Burkholderiaceae bacterium]|nr:hypothetical protein [Burkholderiaceae bacterium]
MLLVTALTACAQKPRTPDWQINAQAAAQKASEAYLSGNTRIEQLEWDRARAEVARTGRIDLLARLELMRCATQVASLVVLPCTRFDALQPDAAAPEQAYADYLAHRVQPAQIPLLPQAQRAVAAVAGAATNSPLVAAAALASIDDPLSRLVAAGVLFQADRASAQVITVATDTASAQGWRRPLLAWLGVEMQLAEAREDQVAASAVRRRMRVIENQGAEPR